MSKLFTNKPNPKPSRLKSSEQIQKILQQTRDLNNHYHKRLITHIIPSPALHKPRKSQGEISQVSSSKFSESNSNSSQFTIKAPQILSIQDISKALEANMRKSLKSANVSSKHKKSLLTNLDNHVRAATPQYFRQALVTIMKEPVQKSFFKRKRLSGHEILH